MTLETLRETHSSSVKGEKSNSTEYGELSLTMEVTGWSTWPFTQIYMNGELKCIVIWRNRNDEVILWPDGHTENWLNGKFQSIQYPNIKSRYTDTGWKNMWTVSPNWSMHVQKFYIEKNHNEIREGIWGSNQKMRTKLEALKALAH
jgi:hypothetical protein